MTALGASTPVDGAAELPAELEGGLVLRQAAAADRDQIIDLSLAAHGPRERWGIEGLLDSPAVGTNRFTVVSDGSRVVSTLALMARTLTFRASDVAVEVAVGQPEYVATDPAYRRRGLIRRQLDVVHRWGAERGDLVDLIVGIPYFYRQFGYEHAAAVDMVEVALDATAGEWRTRPATGDDLVPVTALDRRFRQQVDLATPLTDAAWTRFLTAPPHAPFSAWVAERSAGSGGGTAPASDVGAVALVADWDEPVVYAGSVAGVDVHSVHAVLGAARAVAGPRRLRVFDRPGTLTSAVLQTVGVARSPYTVYARVPDPLALMNHLRPVFDARLAASPFASWSGEVTVSFFSSGARLVIERGALVAVDAVDGHHDPKDIGHAAVPPDMVATLMLGRYGAVGLEERHDDVDLVHHRPLLATLFPALGADLPHEV